MRTRRKTQLDIMKFYQREENAEKRRQQAAKNRKTFWQKLLKRG